MGTNAMVVFPSQFDMIPAPYALTDGDLLRKLTDLQQQAIDAFLKIGVDTLAAASLNWNIKKFSFHKCAALRKLRCVTPDWHNDEVALVCLFARTGRLDIWRRGGAYGPSAF